MLLYILFQTLQQAPVLLAKSSSLFSRSLTWNWVTEKETALTGLPSKGP